MTQGELLELMAQYAPINIEMNDQKYSKLFGDIFKSELRYNTTAKDWFFYDGKRWREDEGGLVAAAKARKFSEILNIYADTIREKFIGQPQEGESQEEKEKREQRESKWKKFAAYAWGFYDARERETLVKDARTVMRVRQEEFDQNLNLFNCQNCTFDLSTMKRHPHTAADMLTKICGCELQPDADCAKWEKFIDEVMQGDKDKAAYLRRVCGYSLTASPVLEKAFILYGSTTRNGKSTFVESFRAMMGDYAGVMQPESLAAVKGKNGSNASPDIAGLAGIRFLSVPEPPKNMLLNVALVKALTGGDAIKARKLYENMFEFRPQFKIFMHCNALPVVTDETLFDSERVRIIEFERHFTEREQNQNLKTELQKPEVLSAILTWALKGLKDFQKNGERPPKCVKAATENYRQRFDKIAMFFCEVMEQEQGKNTAGVDVYQAYMKWCSADSRGYGTEGKQKFFKALRDRGLMRDRGTVNGKSIDNVVMGYVIAEGWQEEEKPPWP